MPNKLKRVIPAFICFAFICWVILQANAGANTVFFNIVAALPYGDKLGHIMLYGVLTLLLNIALGFKIISLAKVKVSVAASLVLFFSVGEEITQAFIPNRNFDILDLIADGVGILLFNGLSIRYVKENRT
ncbi:MAG: trypsin [Gammaproteobacteria bacterium]|nr:MAG: trypsin [Gammaproteobacteria bacterium]